MTVDEALDIVARKAEGRARLPGEELYADEVLAAEVRRLRALLKWQPIQTAPSNERVELSCQAELGVPELRTIGYRPSVKMMASHPIGPTHWRPITPGPEAEETE